MKRRGFLQLLGAIPAALALTRTAKAEPPRLPPAPFAVDHPDTAKVDWSRGQPLTSRAFRVSVDPDAQGWTQPAPEDWWSVLRDKNLEADFNRWVNRTLKAPTFTGPREALRDPKADELEAVITRLWLGDDDD